MREPLHIGLLEEALRGLDPMANADAHSCIAQALAMLEALPDPEVRLSNLEDIVAALRLVDAALTDGVSVAAAMRAILEEAPPTPADNTGGIQLVVRLQREGLISSKERA